MLIAGNQFHSSMFGKGIFVVALCGIASAAVSCPNGYRNYFGDGCYKFVRTRQSWADSRALCNQDGGDIASIHSFEENQALGAAMPDNQESGSNTFYFWIGLRCDVDTQQKSWTDGTPVDYTTFYAEQCSNSYGWVLLTQPYQYEWYYEDLNNEIQVLCKLGGSGGQSTTNAPGATTGLPDIAGSECGNGYELVEESNTCVRVAHERVAWTDAERSCQNDGAHIISIHSRQINDIIRRSAVANRLINGVFIGAQLGDDNVLTWSDGSDVDYNNFNLGMPNKLFGQCSLMDTRTIEAEWTSAYCDNTNRLPYICSKPKPCPANNTYTVSGDIYSPEYPNSLTPGLSCEYFVAASPFDHVLVKFEEFQLVDGDYVLLYDGLSTDTPLAVITSATPNDRFSTDNGSVLRLVHQTGSGRGTRKWRATFAGF